MTESGMEAQKNEEMYRLKVIMAPMVRIGTMPMRLMALEYGADLVYCEEIIDRKILMCQVQENDLLGTTDFTLSDGTVVFRTCAQEKAKLIFQIGTSDAKRALAAAKKVQAYVAGIDVNMGCPKEFSIKGGMGSALLTQPEKVKQILSVLVNGLKVPVTCKIRVLPELEETIKLAKLIESTGVSALAVHGRTKTERSRDPCRTEYIKAVAKAVSIPVIANGGSKAIKKLSDIEEFRKTTCASSVMVARAAEWNCSVFRAEGSLPTIEVVQNYLRYAFKYDNNEMNTKYCVLQIVHDKMNELLQAEKSLTAKSLDDFAEIWDMKEEYKDILRQRKGRKEELQALSSDENQGVKRRKANDGRVLIELPVRFDKRFYISTVTPKQILNNWCKQNRKAPPAYQTTEREGDRCFHSTVLVEEKLYTNPFWEKSKQLAEQSAAICCLVANGQNDGRIAEPENESEELRRKWKTLVERQSEDDSNIALPKDIGNSVSVIEKVVDKQSEGDSNIALPKDIGNSVSVVEKDSTNSNSQILNGDAIS